MVKRYKPNNIRVPTERVRAFVAPVPLTCGAALSLSPGCVLNFNQSEPLDFRPMAQINWAVRTTPFGSISVSRPILDQRLGLRERSDRPNIASLSAAHHEIDGPRSFERSDRPKVESIWVVHS